MMARSAWDKVAPPDRQAAYAAGYLLNHSAGIFPGQQQAIAASLADFAADWTAPENWQLCLKVRQEFLGAWAQLLDVEAFNLCTVESVTGGMAVLLSAIAPTHLSGRSVLIAEDAFPSLHFLLAGMAQRYGYRLKVVRRNAAPFVSDAAMMTAWDSDVGVAIVSWVNSTSGYRHDLKRLAAHAQATGALVCADITQGAGLIPVSLTDAGVDFALTTSLKWACGAPGAGVLYAADRHLDECLPELRGWFSRDNPFDWSLDNFAYAPGAARFQPGTPSVVSCYASLPGLRRKLAHGLDDALSHNRNLADILIRAAQSNGWDLISPAEDDRRGGTVMIRLAHADAARSAVELLASHNIALDARGAVLRLSPGETTDQHAMELVCSILLSV